MKESGILLKGLSVILSGDGIPLLNHINSQLETLYPGQAFYDLMAATNVCFGLMDSTKAQDLAKTLKDTNVQAEFTKLLSLKKDHKLKANILYALFANFDIFADVVKSSAEINYKLTCISHVTRILIELKRLVAEKPKEFGKVHTKVCLVIDEMTLIHDSRIAKFYLTQMKYTAFINKAKTVLSQYQNSNYSRIGPHIHSLNADLAVALLCLKQEDEAKASMEKALSLYRKLKPSNLIRPSVLLMLEVFLHHYYEHDVLNLMWLVKVAKEFFFDMEHAHLKLTIALPKILPVISEFLAKRMMNAENITLISERCGVDENGGALLIKLKKPEYLLRLLQLLKESDIKFESFAAENATVSEFDIAVTIENENQECDFLSICHSAKRELTKAKKSAAQTITAQAPVESLPVVDSAVFDPFAYATNLSEDYEKPVKPKKVRATLKSSLESFKKEIAARRNGMFQTAQEFSVTFKKTGCTYHENTDCDVVALEFQGRHDVYFAVLNPDILVRLPTAKFKSQILSKFKAKIWEKAAFEDCRQEMKNLAANGDKSLLAWLFKVRILGHECGDIRIYGKMVETVANPNSPDHFCHLIAFTGIAENGHKNLPEDLPMPKPASSSEEDDTNSTSEESDSRSSLSL